MNKTIRLEVRINEAQEKQIMGIISRAAGITTRAAAIAYALDITTASFKERRKKIREKSINSIHSQTGK